MKKRRTYQPRVFDGRVIMSLDRQYRDVAGAVAVEILDAPPITRMVLAVC
jgi:hypothetical protein